MWTLTNIPWDNTIKSWVADLVIPVADVRATSIYVEIEVGPNLDNRLALYEVMTSRINWVEYLWSVNIKVWLILDILSDEFSHIRDMSAYLCWRIDAVRKKILSVVLLNRDKILADWRYNNEALV